MDTDQCLINFRIGLKPGIYLYILKKIFFNFFSDIVSLNKDGNVEIIAHTNDLIFDKNDQLVEHWILERLLSQCENIRGVQVKINRFLF